MTRWEYKLIHLNVAPSSGASVSTQGSAPLSPPPPSSQAASVFSKAYLEQEFPDFYAHPPGGGQAAQPANPVLQLQGFLNTQGNEGWCLIGLYPVGPLLLMVFRRRKNGRSSPSAPPVAEPPVASPMLDAILQRLQRLEAGGAWILSEEQRAALPRHRFCSTTEASTQLGCSSASLSHYLRRHDYALGLVKLGDSGWAAVYDGLKSTGTSRRVHRWLVVKATELQ